MNASASLKHRRWFVLELEGDLVDQNDGLSVGDGYRDVSHNLKRVSAVVQGDIHRCR